MKDAHTAGCGRAMLPGARARQLGTTLLATVVLLLAAASTAAAAPVWRVDPLATTTAAPGSTLQYVVQMTNVGEDSLDATVDPWTFTVTLPDGLTAESAFTFARLNASRSMKTTRSTALPRWTLPARRTPGQADIRTR